MCGLVGVMGNYLLEKHKKAFHELFWALSIRGYDSSGLIQVASLAKKATFETFKGPLPAPWLLASKEARAIIGKHDTKALFGHCRSKTIGDNKFENAHPFAFDKVVGMHNGTIHGNYPYRENFETDSEAIFNSINEHGIAETVSELDGAWALTWFDIENSTVNFLRNKERELWFANEKHSDIIFWASEPGPLRWILNRNGIDYDKVVLLATDTLVTFDINDYKPAGTIKVTKGVKRKERTYTKADHPFLEDALIPWIDGTTMLHANDQELAGVPNATDGLPKEKTVSSATSTDIDRVYYGFNKEVLSFTELDEILSEGCVYCGEQPKAGEAVRWISRDDFFCRYCKESPVFDYSKNSKPTFVCH